MSDMLTALQGCCCQEDKQDSWWDAVYLLCMYTGLCCLEHQLDKRGQIPFSLRGFCIGVQAGSLHEQDENQARKDQESWSGRGQVVLSRRLLLPSQPFRPLHAFQHDTDQWESRQDSRRGCRMGTG